MKAPKTSRKSSLPAMMTSLMLASWETVMRRALLMAQNRCPPAEYQRMSKERAEAAAISALTLISSGGNASATSPLAPWHRRAIANAKRLRKK
jgi:hypothetical protein